MRAIIIAAGSHSEIVSIANKMPPCMLPLVDKPFVQHLVEYLIVKGVVTIDFVMSEYPEQLEDLLGDGTRWGAKFAFHPVRDAHQPGKTIRLISRTATEPILIANANALPPVFVNGIPDVNETPIAWMDVHQPNAPLWTGWMAAQPELLAELTDTATPDDILQLAMSNGATTVTNDSVLSIQTFDRLIDAQKAVLAGWQEELVLTGSRRGEGVVIGRGARVHGSAVLTGPLYIGEFTEIGQGATLEPGTVIGRDCVVDAGCRVRESIILPGTYVGKDLDVVGCLADHGILYNARLGTQVKIADDFLLGRITPADGATNASLVSSRIISAVLLLALWPFLLLALIVRAAAGKGDAIFRKRSLKLPAGSNEEQWKYFDRYYIGDPSDAVRGKIAQFLRSDLPGLVNVLRGEMHLVGAPARTKPEVEELDNEWRELYLQSKAGLVTEVRVRFGTAPEKEEQLVSDSFYAVNASRGYDMKLLGAFVRSQFTTHRS